MPLLLSSILLYSLTACAEIAGCFAFWTWLKLHGNPLWLIPGSLSLGLFAVLLTFSPSDHAGRAYALYGGIYIIMSLLWGWVMEHTTPDIWDIIGASLCLSGAAIILFAPHSHT
ncbi:YnfA family protein [Bombella saccharophila]|uniref:YnfA family protein n=1 Tax=Bombella saccharophila TaxID=2967338 RepID=A0ABT3W6W6_9PROT|nr:YnfA family protein [Bombella saccharophila]MCX5614812.1 YnfA family protein [Bombella saccharophila]PHI96891.1 hypothetical protein BG621_02230 [Parasaccharibacter apium]